MIIKLIYLKKFLFNYFLKYFLILTMQRSDNFYKPKFSKYDSGIHDRYKDFAFPSKFRAKLSKNNNYNYTIEEGSINPKDLCFLTEKNNITLSQNNLNGINSENYFSLLNPHIYYKQYNYPETPINSSKYRRIGNIHRKLSMQNDERTTTYNSFFLLNKDVEHTHEQPDNGYYNIFNEYHQDIKSKNDNNTARNFGTSYYQNYNNINEEPSHHNLNNYSCNAYNQPLLKHNRHSSLNKDYHKCNNNNNLNNKYDSQNKYQQKCSFDIKDREFQMNSKTYHNKGNNNIIDEENKENINNNKRNIEINENYNDKLNKNKTDNNYYKNTGNLTKIVKNQNIKNLNKAGKPPLNKNLNSLKFDNFEVSNNLMAKINIQKQNKNKFNKIIAYKRKFDSISFNQKDNTNLIKNINLNNKNDNSNNYLDNKYNNTFYEIKSLTKNLSTKKINQVDTQTNPNNNIVSMRKESNTKENLDLNSNIKLLEDKYVNKKNITKTKKLSLNDLNIKKIEKKNNLQKLITKSKFENSNKSEIINFDLTSIKENINCNIMNYNTNNNANNDIFNQNTNNKKNTNYILNINKIQNKPLQNIQKIDKIYNINKTIINNENDNTKNIINTNKEIYNNNANNNTNHSCSKKRDDSQKHPNTIINIKEHKVIQNIITINNNFFSYLTSPKDKLNVNIKIKRNKKRFKSKKNFIQLMNINNKTYQEDFQLKEKRNKNSILKPQINIRIALFGIKEQENEKYYLVNTFCSENIRDKPEEIESDF